jgi:hypothetical protein
MIPNQQNSIPAPSSLQSALQMEPDQHAALPQPEQAPEQVQQAPPPKRRRKATEGGDEPTAGMTPGTRRLRRSHEACARCRSKKIKASSVGVARRQIPG